DVETREHHPSVVRGVSQTREQLTSGLVIKATRSHFTLDWRADLHADLGHQPLPPIPDDRFWGALRNPAIDSSWYAAQYSQDQD
ncbi:hypothetical protein ABT389_36905, partial [Streptomyces bacillaris]